MRENRSADTIRWDLIAWGVVLAVTLLRIVFALGMPIHPDEADHWDWSRHLDWSYYDQGPGVAVYIRIFTLIFGNTALALKLAALAAAAAAHILLYYAAKEIKLPGPERLGFLAASILIPGFFTGAFLIMHDSVMVLFWTLAFLMLVFWINRRNQPRSSFFLLLAFAAMALGFLGKHTMVLFAFAVTLWFILSPAFWSTLRRPVLYGSIALAAFLTLPFWIWNMQHSWDGFGAIMNLRSSGGAFANKPSTLPYFVGQALSFSPVWLAGFLVLISILFYARLKQFVTFLRKNGIRALPGSARVYFTEPRTGTDVRRFVWIVALVLPVFFLLVSRKREIQANWPFASYGAMMLMMFVYAQDRKWLRLTLLIGAVPAILMNVFFLISEPVSKSALFASWAASAGMQKDPRVLPHLRLAGYSEVIAEVEEFRKKIDPGAEILTNRYQDAAIAGFLLPGQPAIPSINILQRNQYSYWPGPQKGKNYILFMIQDNTCAKASFFFQPVLFYSFRKIKEFPEKEVFKDGVVVKKYQVWYVQEYKRDWRGLLLYYLVDSAIYDFMPNLRGYSLGTTSSEGLMKMQEFLNDFYLKRKGSLDCSVF